MRKIGRFLKNLFKFLFVFLLRKFSDVSEKIIDETADITSEIYGDVEEFLGVDAAPHCEHFIAHQKEDPETTS